MKPRIALAFSLVSSLLASSAFADEVTATARPAARSRIGAQFDFLPSGELSGERSSVDLETAYAIGGFVEFALGPNLSLGAAPRLIMNVKTERDTESQTELDLRVRLMGSFPIAPRIQAYGYVAPGYSIIFLDTNDAGDLHADDPSGLVFGLGAGLSFDLSDTTFASAELTYQDGFHETTVSDGTERAEIELSTSYFGLGLGIGSRF